MIIALTLIVIVLYRKNADKAELYLKCAVLWTLYCFIITELLSVANQLTRRNLFVTWGILDVILLLIIAARYKKYVKSENAVKLKDWLKNHRNVIIWGVFAVLMIILAIGKMPYNWDSMTYHCARLFHWAQNRSVAHYATNNVRQIASPVLAAFINLNVYILTGSGEGVLNLVQCISYLTSGVLVFDISRKLGTTKKGCLLAMVLFYSMPIAFAEALTTQVDNLAAFWMLAFVCLLLPLLRRDQRIQLDWSTFERVIYLSLCVAFGYLTKPSIGFSIVIMGIWLVVMMIIRRDHVRVLCYAPLALLVILLIISPEWYRNLKTFHALASSQTGARQLIGSLHQKHIAVNFLKNFTFNLPTVWIYNSADYVWVYNIRFARLLDVDINNPAISEDGREFSVNGAQTYGCDTAVNPTIVWLILFSILIVVILFRNFKKKELQVGYFISAVLSFLIFCAALRWEPFVSRYMISYLGLLCPAIALVLDGLFEKIKSNTANYMRCIIYFVCVTEMFGLFVYHKEIARLSEGDSGYFAVRPEIYEEYKDMTEYVNTHECKNIGLYIGGDSYEYPLTQMITEGKRIEHVDVDNETAVYADDTFVPDLILVYEKESSDTMTIGQYNYHRVKKLESGEIWAKN